MLYGIHPWMLGTCIYIVYICGQRIHYNIEETYYKKNGNKCAECWRKKPSAAAAATTAVTTKLNDRSSVTAVTVVAHFFYLHCVAFFPISQKEYWTKYLVSMKTNQCSKFSHFFHLFVQTKNGKNLNDLHNVMVFVTYVLWKEGKKIW